MVANGRSQYREGPTLKRSLLGMKGDNNLAYHLGENCQVLILVDHVGGTRMMQQALANVCMVEEALTNCVAIRMDRAAHSYRADSDSPWMNL